MEKKTSFPSLRRFNLFMGGLHLIQGGLMVYLFLTVDNLRPADGKTQPGQGKSQLAELLVRHLRGPGALGGGVPVRLWQLRSVAGALVCVRHLRLLLRFLQPFPINMILQYNWLRVTAFFA